MVNYRLKKYINIYNKDLMYMKMFNENEIFNLFMRLDINC